MATKTKKPARKPAPRKRSPRARANAIKREVVQHPFAPGQKVTVHRANAVEPERNYGREPIGPEISEATVAKDGSLEIAVPKADTYAVSGQVGESWRYVSVGVK